ncbi:hypothetical protein RJ641_018901 [Dillenia turbinata]|uniref:Uncharacterized protein n=1 Tax=Dillenia turbinata TaxID=194707 RepID=A0AAN8UI80_9MAGN
MAKSLRSKREKRLRSIRREIVEPIYDKKETAKLVAQAAALAAPKLPVKPTRNSSSSAMGTAPTTSYASTSAMDVEMTESNQSSGSLKPHGGVGKKSKKTFKVGKGKRRGKGKFKKRKPNF